MTRPESIEGVSDAIGDIQIALADFDRCARFEAFFPPAPKNNARLCNIVLQGGGMLGAAHVGFLYGLESAGIRFAGVAGASAGSIVGIALVCARGRDLGKSTADKLFELVCSVPTDIFIDGPYPIRRLIKRFLRREKVFQLGQLSRLRTAWRRLLARRGLNPGYEFENWLSATLDRMFRVRTNADLQDLLISIEAELKPIQALPTDEGALGLLKLISASVPVGMKFEFPYTLKILADRYWSASPAILVRASMSIPAFFEPVELETKRDAWSDYVDQRYTTLAEGGDREDLKQLDRVYMLDGGVFSNLPLDAFAHLQNIPTLAIALVTKPPAARAVGSRTLKGLAADALGVFTSIKAQRDRDAYSSLLKNVPDLASRLRLIGIDTGEHNWLNFMAGQEDLNDLFARGVKSAARFIAAF